MAFHRSQPNVGSSAFRKSARALPCEPTSSVPAWLDASRVTQSTMRRWHVRLDSPPGSA